MCKINILSNIICVKNKLRNNCWDLRLKRSTVIANFDYNNLHNKDLAICTIPFLFFLLSIFALLISFGKYDSVENIAHVHIWFKSYNCYSNRTLPIMEIIHFVIDNLSIKITLIISLFVILKHSINLPALTLESHYCRSKYIHWYILDELKETRSKKVKVHYR